MITTFEKFVNETYRANESADLKNVLTDEVKNKITSALGKFSISSVGGTNTPSLKFGGFWNKVNLAKLQSIIGSEYQVSEIEYDDDSRKSRYSYELHKSKK
jgi:hypothetical protein